MSDTTWRDDLEAIDPAMVPVIRSFPIEVYADILRRGQAAATKKRYTTRDEATADANVVAACRRYYADWHTELAPVEFGYRVWESAEDGKYRWAIMPEARPHRLRKPARPRALGRPA